MTSEEIAALRELLGKATPGEWTIDEMPIDYDDASINREVVSGAACVCAMDAAQDFPEAVALMQADADLIAAMHNALPALLDAAEECLQEQIRRVRRARP